MKKILKKILPTFTHDYIKKINYFIMRYDWFNALILSKKNLLKDEKIKVSIIIPSHTNIKYAKEAVISALNQTYKNTEVLIMTDMPELGLKEELSGFLDKIIFLSDPNIKMVDKFNFLAKKTTGDFIVLLCDDDKIDSRFIEKTLYILNKKKVDVVYTDTRQFGENKDYGYWKKWSAKNFLETTPTPVTALFKKKVWKEVGGYSGDTYFDWDFWWSAYKKGFKSYHLRQPLFFYRIHPNQDTNICDHKKLKEIILKKHTTI